jgi:hypothetical protein
MEMPYKPETPFDSIEGALEYVGLLVESVVEAREDIAAELEEARRKGDAKRRADALQLVAYKLDRLAEHTRSSRRLLNDLRMLRRLLLDERHQGIAPVIEAEAETDRRRWSLDV